MYLPGKKIQRITKPSSNLVLADSLHRRESGKVDIAIRATEASGTASWAIYENDMARRHSAGSNILWADGHASFIDKAMFYVINNSNRSVYWNTFK